MNFLQPQCSDEDCCGNGIDGSSCTPFVWINACSVGWYLTDRCERDFWFRIKKDGVVVEGPSNAHSYVLTPPVDEVAMYSIEYCEGNPTTCVWAQLGLEIEVDTTVEEPCPMGVQGQAYIIGIPPGETSPIPTDKFRYCQSSIVVRAAALADFGQQITHLWIDDTLFTPNSNYAGALSDDVLLPDYVPSCGSGKGFAAGGVGFNDTANPQLRFDLPIPFSKGSFSVRARQTNGMIVGCVVDIPHCSVHYNAASVTMPDWSGMELDCSATGGMPFGYMGTPSPVNRWSQSFQTTLSIVPVVALETKRWVTCPNDVDFSCGSFSYEYRFQLSGVVRWWNGTGVSSGTYSYDHTVTCTIELVLIDVIYEPGMLYRDPFVANERPKLFAFVTSAVVSGFSGHDDYLDSITPGWSDQYNDTFDANTPISVKNYFDNSFWFDSVLDLGVDCGLPTDDSAAFEWQWQGPTFSSGYWEMYAEDFSTSIPLVPSPLKSGLNAVWPVDTNFECDLPEGSYTTETDSGEITQGQFA